ncbi:metallophosphoesterase [Nostoc sp. CHAB 5834]|nr:metallophosphoesterase [Nostoc sp. CHAB 5834]
MTPFVVRGFLFIGDPHASSKRVGRRQDDFASSVLAKLEACASFCVENGLQALITGDLFHRSDENSLTLLNRLIRVMKKFPTKPITLDGNHDKATTVLEDTDALKLLENADVLRVASAPGLFETFDIEGVTVGLYVCPNGFQLPDVLTGDAHIRVLMTHHDMAFASSYPKSIPLKEIQGCDMAVNGHMHDTKPSVRVGTTWWHNPGNIEPLSVDLINHVPCAWSWSPDQGVAELIPYKLPHAQDVFNLTGLQVEAASPEEAVSSAIEKDNADKSAVTRTIGQFASLLESDNSLDAERTDMAAILNEDIAFLLFESDFSEPAKDLMSLIAGQLTRELEVQGV